MTNFFGTNGCLIYVSFNHVVGWCDPEVKEGVLFSWGGEVLEFLLILAGPSQGLKIQGGLVVLHCGGA